MRENQLEVPTERRSLLRSIGVAGSGMFISGQIDFSQYQFSNSETHFVEMNILAEGKDDGAAQNQICGATSYLVDESEEKIALTNAATDPVVEAFESESFMSRFRRKYKSGPATYPKREKEDVVTETGYRLYTAKEARTSGKQVVPAIRIEPREDEYVFVRVKGKERQVPPGTSDEIPLGEQKHEIIPASAGENREATFAHKLVVINNGKLEVYREE